MTNAEIVECRIVECRMRRGMAVEAAQEYSVKYDRTRSFLAVFAELM